MGQVIYTENLDTVDHLYFVKSGQFECSKLHPKNLEMPQSTAENVTAYKNNNFELHKMKQVLIMEAHSFNPNGVIQFEPLKICVHSTNDIFGYQELTKGQDCHRLFTVKCISTTGHLIRIHRQHLDVMFRKCFHILTRMIRSFEAFVSDRQLNKITINSSVKDIHTNDRTLLSKQKLATFTEPELDEIPEDHRRVKSTVITPPKNQTWIDKGFFEQMSTMRTKESAKMAKPHSRIKIQGIPDKFQPYVNHNYRKFQQGLISSISKEALNNIKNIESQLELKISKQARYIPENLFQMNDKLAVQMANKKLRVNQILFQPNMPNASQSVVKIESHSGTHLLKHPSGSLSN